MASRLFRQEPVFSQHKKMADILILFLLSLRWFSCILMVQRNADEKDHDFRDTDDRTCPAFRRRPAGRQEENRGQPSGKSGSEPDLLRARPKLLCPHLKPHLFPLFPDEV